MNLAIDCRPINWYNGTGIGTYTENLVKNIININNDNNNLNFIWHGNNYNDYKTKNSNIVFSSKKQSNFFNNFFIPNFIEKNKIDIYHIPQNGIGYSKNIPSKVVVTIHDLIPYILPETVGDGYLIKFLKQMPEIIENSSGIITVSEYSKNDIKKFFPYNNKEIKVTYLAADKIYKPINKNFSKKFLKSNYSIDAPFLLYIGGFSKRKNVKFILECFSMLKNKDIHLVIGGQIKSELDSLLDLANKLKIRNRVILPGFIQTEHLPFFYNCCEVFLYPSLYEGFGLPPLEAMNCGCAIVASNSTSIPEIVSNGGILVDPKNHNLFSNVINDILINHELKIDLSKRALKRSSIFSWKNTSFDTLEFYKKLLL